MTAAETIELAHVSVDQIQRGLMTAQEKLDQADALLEVVDSVVENVTVQARKMPRRILICGAVAAIGIVVIVIIKKRRRAQMDEEIEEILT
jgi:hypothetical protein